MLCPEILFRFIQWNGLPAFKLIYATLDGRERFGPIQAFQHDLVAFGVLDDEFCPPVNRKDKRGLVLLQSTNVVLDVALKLRNGANLSQVNHPEVLIMHKADNSTLPCPEWLKPAVGLERPPHRTIER